LKNKIIMAVDPSINTAGVAIFAGKYLQFADLIKPRKILGKEVSTDQTVKKTSKVIDYVDKARSVFTQIKKLNKDYSVELVVLEVPDYWGVAGYMARESGAVFKLMFVVGMLASLDNVFAVNPQGWKGQLKKHHVANRLRLIYKEIKNEEIKDHNVIDAIGIAHWYLYGKVG
jgi:hypothetical protein